MKYIGRPEVHNHMIHFVLGNSFNRFELHFICHFLTDKKNYQYSSLHII
jgi:hypothetical protein